MEDFVKQVREHAREYGSIPFWSWNDRLEPAELRRQLRVMDKIGMHGAFMHARGGLETGYLSEDWYECVRQCVDEAKQLGMEAWSYDENGWPSGFAGGKLLEDPVNRTTYLGCETSTVWPTPPAPGTPPSGKMGRTNENDEILGVYVIEDSVCRRVTGPVAGATYHIVRKGVDASYVDTLDAEITRKFVAATHEEYKKRVGFSEAMPGFFTDEPQYYRWATPWSNKLPAEFEAKYGYDVFGQLPALFVDFADAELFRYDYYHLIHELFITNFVKVIYDWCEANGCKLTGHAVEESFLAGQMWCCGGVMPFYEYEHIPGIDYLTRNFATDLASRQLGSVCAQLGKPKALSEMFACCGWDVSPNELKNIAELQYAGGVNVMCQHLYPYSERGQRKRDYPAHYSEHLPWQEALGDFNRYFNNLGALLSRGEEPVDTLVIHPIHSAWLRYKREEDESSIAELQDGLTDLTNLLAQNQIGFHYADEWLLRKHGSVAGDRIRLGKCEYKSVVVPLCETLDGSTAAFLREFLAGGGKVWLYADAPTRIDGRLADLSWLRGNVTFADICAAAPTAVRLNGENVPAIRQMARRLEDGTRAVYLTSLAREPLDGVEVRLRGMRGVREMRLDTLETLPVSARRDGADIVVTLDFADSESHVLLESDDEPRVLPRVTPKALRLGKFTFAEKPENALTLDYAELSLDGAVYEPRRPVMAIKDQLLRARHEGRVWLRFTYRVAEVPECLRVCAEPLPYTAVTVNGNAIALGQPWWFDRSFVTADVAPYTRVGENEIVFAFDYRQSPIVYEVLYGGAMESLRNCLNFDTEIEFVYLYGDFAVTCDMPLAPDSHDTWVCDGGFTVRRQKDAIDLTNVVADGFPFFAGELRAKTTLDWKPGDATLLKLTGRYAVCGVYVNGEFAARLLFETGVDVGKWLRPGANEIELRLVSSNRNLLGPHHFADPEPYAVAPDTFSQESRWQDGEARGFMPRYAFVRLGVDA